MVFKVEQKTARSFIYYHNIPPSKSTTFNLLHVLSYSEWYLKSERLISYKSIVESSPSCDNSLGSNNVCAI